MPVGIGHALGFVGTDEVSVAKAAADAPHLLARASSASAMWAANAATVTPSADSGDGRVHMTVANLRTMPHRAIEAPQTARTLRAIFRDESRFAVHDALPGTDASGAPTPFGDEGAANHTRFTASDAAGGELRGDQAGIVAGQGWNWIFSGHGRKDLQMTHRADPHSCSTLERGLQ
jgi:succinylarginine dihydrolase